MEGLSYVTDDSGKRIAVQIDLAKNAALWDAFKQFVADHDNKETINNLNQAETGYNQIMEKIKQLQERKHLETIIAELEALLE